MTPVFRQPYCPKRQGILSHSTSKEDTIYIASSPLPTGTLTADTRQIVNLYKVLGRREPDSKLGNLTNSLTVAPVDYLSSHEGYLPSNMEDLSPHEATPTDSLELEHQHISLSIFASSSLHPLTFCGERLTLDQLKLGYDSLMNNEAWCLESQCIPVYNYSSGHHLWWYWDNADKLAVSSFTIGTCCLWYLMSKISILKNLDFAVLFLYITITWLSPIFFITTG